MSEWRTAPLQELARWYSGGTPNTAIDEYWNGSIPWISAASLKDFYIETADRCVTSLGVANGTRLVPTGTTIFVVRGMSLMSEFRIGITSKEVAFGQDCKALVPADGIDPYFLAYAIKAQTPAILGLVDATGHGTGRLQTDRIASLQFRVPAELPMQRAVVAPIKALDDKIAVNRNSIVTSDELSRLKYAEAIRQGSRTLPLSELAAIFDGPHATPKKTPEGPWFLSISSLVNGRLLLAESAHIGEYDFAKWTKRVTPRFEDTLFSYETRLGEAALMPRGLRACLGRRMALLRPSNGTFPRILLQAFLSRTFQETIRQRAIHGATVDRIPLTDMPDWPIDLPAHNCERLEDVLASLEDLASLKQRENEILADLRDTLLAPLMSGALRVRGAELAIGAVT